MALCGVNQLSSPRPWGCFLKLFICLMILSVFPTSVGVFLRKHQRHLSKDSLPHVRGGVSDGIYVCIADARSSPRPWGCFLTILLTSQILLVFPTSVGVFLMQAGRWASERSLPHVRGGVSQWSRQNSSTTESSPRPWGCFPRILIMVYTFLVFPTSVGVFPGWLIARVLHTGLPHVRGGVSKARDRIAGVQMSSPRPWGCFCHLCNGHAQILVFPTSVGVFLHPCKQACHAARLPHVRGGVSACYLTDDSWIGSSPRPWGCFSCLAVGLNQTKVFPTSVGVFLLAKQHR